GGGPGRGSYVAGGRYGVSMRGMIASQLSSMGNTPSKRDMAETRRQYLRRLSQQRAQALATIRRQREALAYRHPEPQAVWAVTAQARRWARGRGGPALRPARGGVGPQGAATPPRPPPARPAPPPEPAAGAPLSQLPAPPS